MGDPYGTFCSRDVYKAEPISCFVGASSSGLGYSRGPMSLPRVGAPSSETMTKSRCTEFGTLLFRELFGFFFVS